MERMPLCHCWKPAAYTLTFLLLQSLVLIQKPEKQSLKPEEEKGQSVLRQTHMFSPNGLAPNRGYGWRLFVGR